MSSSHASLSTISIKRVMVDGLSLFYREAGAIDAPVLLALHGFPTSSIQYRALLDGLSDKYRVIAPDLPGFGFTEVPDERNYVYTFENLAKTVGAFVDKLEINSFALFIFDYGAPVGLRLALERPNAVKAIITQNGNAFEAGLGAFWDTLRPYWADPLAATNREAVRELLSFEATKAQYLTGESSPSAIPPESYVLAHALLLRPGNADIQLSLFHDYQTNLALYPSFQAYLAARRPPVLAVWGAEDPIFVPAGARAFKDVVPEAEVVLIEGAGHFALEAHAEEIVERARAFLGKVEW
ncbi:hypothetical protein JCM10207_003354 [Rhodosporidiobolus poonsookiae]